MSRFDRVNHPDVDADLEWDVPGVLRYQRDQMAAGIPLDEMQAFDREFINACRKAGRGEEVDYALNSLYINARRGNLRGHQKPMEKTAALILARKLRAKELEDPEHRKRWDAHLAERGLADPYQEG